LLRNRAPQTAERTRQIEQTLTQHQSAGSSADLFRCARQQSLAAPAGGQLLLDSVQWQRATFVRAIVRRKSFKRLARVVALNRSYLDEVYDPGPVNLSRRSPQEFVERRSCR